MKNLPLLVAAFLVLSMAVAALDLNEYPQPFVSGGSFAGQIVVGGDKAPATDVLAATEIAVNLQQQTSGKITAATEDEFANLTGSILIGLPCQNSAVAYALGTNSCDLGLPENTGYIKLASKEGKTFLIVTGKIAADTRKAARALAKHGDYELSGTDIFITGTLESPKVQILAQPLNIPAQPPEPQCKADADCLQDEWCLAGKCSGLGCPDGTEAMNHDCMKRADTPTITERPETQPPSPPNANLPPTPAAEPAPTEPEKRSFFAKIMAFFKSIFS